jgi:hypothetical protein
VVVPLDVPSSVVADTPDAADAASAAAQLPAVWFNYPTSFGSLPSIAGFVDIQSRTASSQLELGS